VEPARDNFRAQATSSARQPEKQHLFYIDNLRVFLTALVMCVHAAVAHGGPGSWYYTVPPPEGGIALVLLTMFIAISQTFFMSLFFMVSAYFTRLSYDRKGPRVFLKDRLARLGIPLLTYFFLLNPTLEYIIYRYKGETQASYFSFMIHNIIRESGTGPLWFVLTLLIFAAVYVVLRVTARGSKKKELTLPLPTNRQILVFVIGVGLITFLVRLRFPVGWNILDLQFAYFPLYMCMYIFGVWACRFSWLDDLRAKQANLWFGVSVGLIALIPVIMALGGALDGSTEAFEGGPSWEAFVYATWEPVLCVGISMKLLLVFRNRFNRENGLTRRMARSAYTAYIIHPYFVVCGTFLFVGLPLDPLTKFIALCPLVVAACFVVSNVIRQAPLLRRVL
jgi:surface polysaccharide O-acyltransferase-like enzyme